MEQKFGVQRDAMEDEEDDTQIVEDEIPPPQSKKLSAHFFNRQNFILIYQCSRRPRRIEN